MSSPTLIIAEAGVNHNGSIALARQLIDAAVSAGANIVKFQTFQAGKLTTASAPKALYQIKATGNRHSQQEMLKSLELSHADHRNLKQYAEKQGIEFLSTPFDTESLHFLNLNLKLKRHKIPSGELTNAPLVLEFARTKKTIILSTGMSTIEEIETAVGLLLWGWIGKGRLTPPSAKKLRGLSLSPNSRKLLSTRLTLLQCTTEYPAPFKDLHLKAMAELRRHFSCAVGLSDHSPGITAPIAAVALGATVIEKHLTLYRGLSGPDHRASLEPSEFLQMVKAIRETELALGGETKKVSPSEQRNRTIARKSLVAARAIKKGELFSEENLTIKRPGTGRSPLQFWDTLGQKAKHAYKKDEVIK